MTTGTAVSGSRTDTLLVKIDAENLNYTWRCLITGLDGSQTATDAVKAELKEAEGEAPEEMDGPDIPQENSDLQMDPVIEEITEDVPDETEIQDVVIEDDTAAEIQEEEPPVITEDTEEEGTVVIIWEDGADGTEEAATAEDPETEMNAEDITPVEESIYYYEIGRASLGKECRSRWSPYH